VSGTYGEWSIEWTQMEEGVAGKFYRVGDGGTPSVWGKVGFINTVMTCLTVQCHCMMLLYDVTVWWPPESRPSSSLWPLSGPTEAHYPLEATLTVPLSPTISQTPVVSVPWGGVKGSCASLLRWHQQPPKWLTWTQFEEHKWVLIELNTEQWGTPGSAFTPTYPSGHHPVSQAPFYMTVRVPPSVHSAVRHTKPGGRKARYSQVFALTRPGQPLPSPRRRACLCLSVNFY
jgi:hypothetical protein